jgi:hypothetical protein
VLAAALVTRRSPLPSPTRRTTCITGRSAPLPSRPALTSSRSIRRSGSMRLREGLRSNRRCDVSVLGRIMEDYAFLCIYASRRNALNSACAVNRAAGRRTPRTHTGHRWMTGIRFMRYRVPLTQGDAVDEPGSSIGRLCAGRHVGAQMAVPRRGP